MSILKYIENRFNKKEIALSNILLSVIIVSYKNLELLSSCIESIYRFNDIGEKLEIIVIDNSPEDNIYTVIQHKFKEVTIKRNENNGFGQANNVGMKLSKGEYLLFLNPDTVLIEPVFKFALEQFSSNNKLGLFGVKLVDDNLKENLSFYFIDRTDLVSNIIIKIFNRIDYFDKSSMFISGANMFTRKQAFMDAGLFDDQIFMYYEESDLIKRIKKTGWSIDYFKSKRIIHLEGGTTFESINSEERRLNSLKYYCKKYNMNFQNEINKERGVYQIKLLISKIMRLKSSEYYLKLLNLLDEFSE